MNKSCAPLSILLLDAEASAPATHAYLSQALRAQTRFLLVHHLPEIDQASFELARPDIVLLGLPRGDLHGIQAARRIRSLAQQVQQVQVVVLSDLGREEDIFRGLKAGARGYLLRDAPATQVIECLHTVARGSRYVSPFVAGKLIEKLRHNALCEAELDILQMLAEGRSTVEIAQRAMINEGSLEQHVNTILFKISVAQWSPTSNRVARRSVASLH